MLEDIVRFFKNLLSALKSRKGKFPFFIVLICFLILIPTVFAVVYAYFYDNSDSLIANVVKIELYAPSGELIARDNVMEANIADSPLVSVFHNINATKTSTARPDDFNAELVFKLVIKQLDESDEFSCFFTEYYESSYLEDKSGAFFSVNKTAYENFLNSQYSETVYSNASPPALITGNGETVMPATIQWNYQKKNGEIFVAENCKVTSEIINYKIGGSINLDFEDEPDICLIKISDINENEVFSGEIRELPLITVESGTFLHARIVAEWEERDGVSAYGKTSYEFTISIGDRAHFFLNSTDISPAQFLTLSATGVDDISRIIFSLKPEIPFSDIDTNSTEYTAITYLENFAPSFIQDDNTVRTLIPFPSGLPEGKYELTISFGVAKQIFTINVTSCLPRTDAIIRKSFDDVAANLSSSAIYSFNSLLQNVPTTNQQLILFKGTFLSPTDNGFTSGYVYESSVSISDSTYTFVAQGNEYLATSPGGASVPVINAGTVIDIGYSEYLGRYVVVEHGMGLRTWYGCLSDVGVEVGDTLSKGDFIGKCGSDGLVSSSGVLIMCSVYDVLIDPCFIINREISY